jgi:hypothetical protein
MKLTLKPTHPPINPSTHPPIHPYLIHHPPIPPPTHPPIPPHQSQTFRCLGRKCNSRPVKRADTAKKRPKRADTRGGGHVSRRRSGSFGCCAALRGRRKVSHKTWDDHHYFPHDVEELHSRASKKKQANWLLFCKRVPFCLFQFFSKCPIWDLSPEQAKECHFACFKIGHSPLNGRYLRSLQRGSVCVVEVRTRLKMLPRRRRRKRRKTHEAFKTLTLCLPPREYIRAV